MMFQGGRKVRTISCIVLAATLLSVAGVGQRAHEPDGTKDAIMFASNECFAKGGLGIIRKDLYVDVKSTKNELVLSAGNRWTGLDATVPEVVIFFQSKVWPPQSLPDGFDLSKAVVVSFERSRIRFFDFDKVSGGYYRRGAPN